MAHLEADFVYIPNILWIDLKALDNLFEMFKPALNLARNYRLDAVFTERL